MLDNFLLNILPMLTTFILTLAYLPQIIYTFKTKDVTGISLQFWIMINVSLTMLLVNAIVIYVKFGTYGYAITEALNEGMAFIMLLMVLKYRKKKQEDCGRFT